MTSVDPWRETTSGNRLSRHTQIYGGQKIVMSGMCVVAESCKLFGNVQMRDERREAISMGLFCVIDKGCLLKPSQIAVDYDKCGKKPESNALYRTLTMGSFVFIGMNCEVHCHRIGRRVIVGSNCQLSRGCELGDVVVVEPNVTIPEMCKVPSYTRVRQHEKFRGAVQFTPLSGSLRNCIENWCREAYLGLPLDLEELLADLQHGSSI
ncbi:LAME_0F08350g1_1 [Lachancea meyersii CBS 8951]|uniref:Dynactin subunit 5 n=1 Tax=Lachancea meyersii CBS 8951 TaxID=1266667 RepID=A0A1G4JUS3_9SACH|nr:LAME_0F08350g1_1 [Lachancea meyersii CBS 8951]